MSANPGIYIPMGQTYSNQVGSLNFSGYTYVYSGATLSIAPSVVGGATNYMTVSSNPSSIPLVVGNHIVGPNIPVGTVITSVVGGGVYKVSKAQTQGGSSVSAYVCIGTPVQYGQVVASAPTYGSSAYTGKMDFYTPGTGLTAPTMTMRNGNVGIGTQSPQYALDISGSMNVTSKLSVQSASIALGQSAGQTSQSTGAIAIGTNSGQTSQGTNSIAMGTNAGNTSQSNNSIQINATGSTVSQTNASSCIIAPIRETTPVAADYSLPLLYDTTSKEVIVNNNIYISISGTTASSKSMYNSTLGILYNATAGTITLPTPNISYPATINIISNHSTNSYTIACDMASAFYYKTYVGGTNTITLPPNQSIQFINTYNVWYINNASYVIGATTIQYPSGSLPTFTSSQIGYQVSGTPYSGVINTATVYSSSVIALPIGVWALNGNMCVQSSGPYAVDIAGYNIGFSTNNTSFSTLNNETTWGNGAKFATTGYGGVDGGQYLSKCTSQIVSISSATNYYFLSYFTYTSAGTISTLSGYFTATRIA